MMLLGQAIGHLASRAGCPPKQGAACEDEHCARREAASSEAHRLPLPSVARWAVTRQREENMATAELASGEISTPGQGLSAHLPAQTPGDEASENSSAEVDCKMLAPTPARRESLEHWFFCGGGDVMRMP